MLILPYRLRHSFYLYTYDTFYHLLIKKSNIFFSKTTQTFKATVNIFCELSLNVVKFDIFLLQKVQVKGLVQLGGHIAAVFSALLDAFR